MALFQLTIIETTKKIVEDALREIQEERNDVELSFSSCSFGKVREHLARMQVGYEVGDKSVLPATDLVFVPFKWLSDEVKDTQRAKEHLQNQLSQFGVHFGIGQYDLYDVHNNSGILSLDDRWHRNSEMWHRLNSCSSRLASLRSSSADLCCSGAQNE